MSQRHSIRKISAEWDRYGEASQTFIDEKATLTPCFVTHVKNALEFAIYRDEQINNPELTQSNVCFMPFYLGIKTMSPLLEAVDQKTLSGEYAYRPFIENTVFGFDPCTEAMVLVGNQKEILASKQTPKIILDYFKEIDKQRKNKKIDNVSQFMRESNNRFWMNLSQDTKERNKMILTDFENAKKFGANFFLPRTPFINSLKSFELWKEFDTAGKSLGYDGVVTTYLACNDTVLYDNKLIQEIIDFITEDPTELTVIKFKKLNLTDLNKHTEFDNYKLLLEEINGIKKAHENKSFMLLENYYQTYPSAVSGIDYVSTSLRGNDADFVKGGNPKEEFSGWWLHPTKLINYRRSEVREMSRDVGIPCNCTYCKEIKDLTALTPDYWNTHRRKHALVTWNKLMKDLRTFILEKNVEKASEEVLEQSRLKLFKELIPTYG